MKELSKLKELDIYGQNQLNQIYLDILPEVLENLNKFKGKKMYKADGSRTEATKFEIKTPEKGKIDGHFRSVQANIQKSVSALWLKLKICYNGGDYNARPISTAYTQYFEKEIYIGKLNGQNLEEVSTLETLERDYKLGTIYNLEQENARIEEFNALYKKLNSLSYEIPYFFKK